MPTKYVVLYESAVDMLPNARIHFPAHQERWKGFLERGQLLGIGTFADAQKDGSMGIFATRKAAEEFVKGDPFVLNGVVRSWRILDWNDAVAEC